MDISIRFRDIRAQNGKVSEIASNLACFRFLGGRRQTFGPAFIN